MAIIGTRPTADEIKAAAKKLGTTPGNIRYRASKWKDWHRAMTTPLVLKGKGFRKNPKWETFRLSGSCICGKEGPRNVNCPVHKRKDDETN